MTSIKIPNSVTKINERSFASCSGLTSIEIPNSVTSIYYNAFFDCSGLESIIVESGNSVYDSRDNCNAIVETATNSLLSGCKNTTIPNSVTDISYYAFRGCTGLTAVEIPNSVTSIGQYAFDGCSGLTSVVIPNSVTSIGENAFDRCSGLTSVVIPNSVTSIANSIFYDCSGLTSIEIPNSVTSTGNYTFIGCTALTTIIIRATKAPSVYEGTFGNSTSNYTGRNNYDKGTNILYVPSGATGYDTSYWASVLLDSTKCGFTISYTL